MHRQLSLSEHVRPSISTASLYNSALDFRCLCGGGDGVPDVWPRIVVVIALVLLLLFLRDDDSRDNDDVDVAVPLRRL